MISPSLVTLEKGTSMAFSAEVIGQNKDITWYIQDSSEGSSTYINTSGELFIGYNENSSIIKVFATSVKYPDVYGLATINVVPYLSKAIISQENIKISASIPDSEGQTSLDANTNISITLVNSFTNNILSSYDVSSWFNLVIPGLSYIANSENNNSIINIQIYGKPTQSSNTKGIVITIPNNILTDMENNLIKHTIIAEGNITYDIFKGVRLENLDYLTEYLNSIPLNLPENPYFITLLSISSVADLYNTLYTSIGSVESGYGYRYVSLDLFSINNISSWSSSSSQEAKNQIISIILPSSISTIDGSIFSYSSNLKSFSGLNVNSMTSIINCKNLVDIDFPNMTSSPYFAGCTSIKIAHFPKVKNIATMAFQDCIALETAIFPELLSLSLYSFRGCSQLKTIDMPKLTKIDNYSFADCVSLVNINFPSATIIIANSFYKCFALENISIPSITEIGSDPFYGCENLNSLKLGDIPPSFSHFRIDTSGSTVKPSEKYNITIYVPVGKIQLYELWYNDLQYLFDVEFYFQEY
jgi:hypothetical protein